VLAETESTTRWAAEAARAGAAEGLVVVAESQTAGGAGSARSWVSPPGGLTVSVCCAPRSRTRRVGLAPAADRRGGRQRGPRPDRADAVVKWPNDVLVGGRKLAGSSPRPSTPARSSRLRAQRDHPRRGAAARRRGDEPGIERARTTDRSVVLRAVLRALAAAYDGWQIDPAPAARRLSRVLRDPRQRRPPSTSPAGGAVMGGGEEVDVEGRSSSTARRTRRPTWSISGVRICQAERVAYPKKLLEDGEEVVLDSTPTGACCLLAGAARAVSCGAGPTSRWCRLRTGCAG